MFADHPLDDAAECYDAGFDAVHWDVSGLATSEQVQAVWHFGRLFTGSAVEIGGERCETAHNIDLANIALSAGLNVDAIILQAGGHIDGDRQKGYLHPPRELAVHAAIIHEKDAATKVHNFDWVGDRVARYGGVVDFYNLAPELAEVEILEWLCIMDPRDAAWLMEQGYREPEHKRWFMGAQGTPEMEARCGIRYVMAEDRVRSLLDKYDDTTVRGVICDAINAG